MALLEVKNLKKVYTTRFGGNQVQALSNVSFSVEEGEYVAIMGESGSGKTTLLNILASLDKPTSGEVLLEGKNLTKIKDKDISAFRREHLGFVFQDFNLLDTFSVQDNIFLPLVLSGKPNPDSNKHGGGGLPSMRYLYRENQFLLWRKFWRFPVSDRPHLRPSVNTRYKSCCSALSSSRFRPHRVPYLWGTYKIIRLRFLR